MIISDARKAAFIHIPKCGGTTIRACLRTLNNIEDWNEITEHELLGRIDTTHLTLSRLREHFPLVFEKLSHYETFALVRDPFSRFISSLYQRIKMYEHLNPAQMTFLELRSEAERVCEKLSYSSNQLPVDLVHFQPQSDYVFLDDRRIAKAIFLMSDRVSIAEYTRRVFGNNLDVALRSDNRSNSYRSRFVGEKVIWLKRNTSLNKLIPDYAKAPLRKFLYSHASNGWRQKVISSTVAAFIADFYQKDIELIQRLQHQAVVSQ
ncbi:MAG: sulfotransferase family 2 domain-containing protein [Pseudomonadota bacterium]